jgi:hypothetical protein
MVLELDHDHAQLRVTDVLDGVRRKRVAPQHLGRSEPCTIGAAVKDDAPSPSRRMKLVALTTYPTLAQRCVCTAVRSPTGTTVSSTRTRSFSSIRRW